MPTLQYQIQESNTNQESSLLYLNNDNHYCNWSNLYAFEDAVAKTISWYQNAEKSCETYEISQEQVRSYLVLHDLIVSKQPSESRWISYCIVESENKHMSMQTSIRKTCRVCNSDKLTKLETFLTILFLMIL